MMQMAAAKSVSLAAAVGLPALITSPNNQSEATWARQDQDARLTWAQRSTRNGASRS